MIRVDRYSPSWVWASSSAWRTAVRAREAVDDLAPPAGCTHPEAVAKRTRSQHGASGDLPSFRSMSESSSVAGTTAPVFVERSARISEEIGPEGQTPGPWSRRLLGAPLNLAARRRGWRSGRCLDARRVWRLYRADHTA